jgi:phenylpyruvate tautomerase PptA (4-oxalocrotonate tautomerase family)
VVLTVMCGGRSCGPAPGPATAWTSRANTGSPQCAQTNGPLTSCPQAARVIITGGPPTSAADSHLSPQRMSAELMEALTHTLLKWEGARPDNKRAQSIAWTFLHEPELVTVAGRPTDEPRYRVIVGVPQGSIGDEEKRGLVAEVTEQVLRAENPDRDPTPRSGRRVWVIINEITDGSWAAQGRIFRLDDILTFAGASQDDIAVRTARLRQQAAV